MIIYKTVPQVADEDFKILAMFHLQEDSIMAWKEKCLRIRVSMFVVFSSITASNQRMNSKVELVKQLQANKINKRLSGVKVHNAMRTDHPYCMFSVNYF